MKIYFIRHGRTPGNKKKRYVGRTDESLCEEEALRLANSCFPKVDKVYTSSMKRCIETAQILYPDQDPIVVDHLQECDFGAFEYKNYEELKDEKAYQTFSCSCALHWLFNDIGGFQPDSFGNQRR